MTEDTRPIASQPETAPAAPVPEATPTAPETPETPDGVAALSEALDRLAASRSEATSLRAKLEGHTKANAELKASLAATRAQRAADAARYRDLALAAHPEVPPALVAGATIEAVESSLANARAIVAEVRQRLEHAQSQAKATPEPIPGPPLPPVPAGAPPRRRPDLSALTPEAKIAYGLAQKDREAG